MVPDFTQHTKKPTGWLICSAERIGWPPTIDGTSRQLQVQQTPPSCTHLDDTNDRLVGLWRHDVAWHHHDLPHLSARLLALCHVHVHLITIKVSVVGRGDRQVEPAREDV